MNNLFENRNKFKVIFICNKETGKYYKNMFNKIFYIVFFLQFINTVSAQLNVVGISQNDLKIWSSDQYYLFEFYLQNNLKDQNFQVRVESVNESSIIKMGLGNEVIDSPNFNENLCINDEMLIRVFFKHVPNQVASDSIRIIITTDSSEQEVVFNYELVEEEDRLVKLFQPNFTKYMILDIDYGSVKEVILYTENRSEFEHIKSRSRLLDLSFLEKGKYILEINNEEYIINKM